MIRLFATLLLATMVGFHDIPDADADVTLEYGADVVVEDAYATAGAVGGRSYVRFRIINHGRQNLHLLGLSTDVAGGSKLLADVGTDKPAVLESINIPAESTLDLTTSHLKYEIYPLQVDLHPGATFVIILDFVRKRIPADVHVHSP